MSTQLTLLALVLASQSLLAAPPRFTLVGFGQEAVTYNAGTYKHPVFTYAWYSRPFSPGQINQEGEYEGIVTEQNGDLGIAAHPGGFQPIRSRQPVEPGSIVRVRGNLIQYRVRPYWMDVAIELKEITVLFTAAQVESQKKRAEKLWKQSVGSHRDFTCKTSRRAYKIDTPPLKEFAVNWASDRHTFVFSFSENTGMPRSMLLRDFFLVYAPGADEFSEVEGICRFYEDLC